MSDKSLQGWIPSVATGAEIRAALEEAFGYRGDVTLTLKDGAKVEGYIFDRRSNGATLADCRVRLLVNQQPAPVSVPYDQIAALEFTGRDPATGKSFETWIAKYRQRKAAGEKNISLTPESLD